MLLIVTEDEKNYHTGTAVGHIGSKYKCSGAVTIYYAEEHAISSSSTG
jgi:hypothetical protein